MSPISRFVLLGMSTVLFALSFIIIFLAAIFTWAALNVATTGLDFNYWKSMTALLVISTIALLLARSISKYLTKAS
jgi:hypothetical protein